MKKMTLILVLMGFAALVSLPILYAATVEQLQQTETQIEKEKLLRERIEKEKKEPKIEEKSPVGKAPAVSKEKVLIKKINVTGATMLSEGEVNKIISSYENKEISLQDMQKVADLITDAYRQKGYITSRAYLPPQKIKDGLLEIRVVEGVAGDIEVKGNRYFKSSLFSKKIALKKGDSFNYETLRKGLSKMNEKPDRNAKAVLAPGKEPGTTDIVLDVKDRYPLHVGFNWDNFGSRYIEKDRCRLDLTDNNLFGWGDILAVQYQLAEGENYTLVTLRYTFPVTDSLDLSFFAADSKLELQRELEDTDTRGKSRLYSIFATQSLINTENLNLSLNFGFDYKDIFNFANGIETSRDRLRTIKLGFDFDLADRFGRTLITNEVDYGIPDIMGGLKKQDSRASRDGSGGKFVKENINLLRLQRMPFNSTLLWKNQLQFSPYILTSAEQYQIGGIANVRGYPPAEMVGDRGIAMTWEYSIPPYFIPKDIKVPLSKARLYDALRFVTFYDWGNTRLRRPASGEEKTKTLRSAGCGVRFNLPEDFALRVEFAWPLDNTPTDSDHLHTLATVSKSF